jgi:prepilin-type N-terminal cleavage/methylation domain-containing protein
MLNRLYQLKKSEEGFTLIELMIVMVVLGILAGIVLFAVGNFQNDATTAKNTANTRICETAKAASLAKSNTTANWASYVASGTSC